MSKNSDTGLPAEFAEDWTPTPKNGNKSWVPQAPPLPEGPLTQVLVVSNGDYLPEEVAVISPNGTRVRITADPITGGLRVTQAPRAGTERGMFSAVPLGLGTLLLDDRA